MYIRVTETHPLYAESNTASRLESQTVTFRDAAAEWQVGYTPSEDSTRDLTYHGDVELSDFFARPVQIKAYTWTPGSTWTTDTFDPWKLYFANPRVSNRMSNYMNFRGKLCLKFLVNGNSFYYGRMMAYYSPLPLSDSTVGMTVGVPAKMMGSQRLKMFIDPTESQAGIMKVPFIWYYDMVNLVSTSESNDLGYITMLALNELKHANGSTTAVSITVYAWMEDVKLSAPTSSNASFITTQGGKDEYGSGIISAPASAITRMAGKLESAPIIGKYARATSIASGAAASVAKLFGMSRPVAIEPPQPMIPRYVSGFSVTDVTDPVAKLTVDSKQELGLGSAPTGIDGGDEMTLKSIAGKESYLTTFSWTVANVPNTVLFAARPSPQHYYRAGTPAYTTVPACCFVANAFHYWRGTMRYRFQVVCSGYHKGRLLLVWDPCKGALIPETNVQYSKIVDISTERDFTIDIGWGQPLTWLETTDLTLPYFVTGGTTYTTPAYTTANGVLTAYVLNDLTTPNSSINNDIQVNVFVSMCDDAEFATPDDRINTYSMWTQGVTPQGGTEIESAPENNAPVMHEGTEAVNECVPKDDATALVYMGETISSFRQLIRRYNLLTSIGNVGATAGYFVWRSTDFPVPRGYYASGLRTGTTLTYNHTRTTMLNYMAFAFIFFRGGTRRKYVYNANTATSSGIMVIDRNMSRSLTVPALTSVTTATQAAMEDQAIVFNTTGLEGMHLTVTSQQPVLEVEFPFYTNARFASCRTGYALPTLPSTFDLTHKFTAFNLAAPALYNVYSAAAEDSNFSCFQGCMPFQVNGTFT